jgi:hypothetical protein
MKTLQEQYNLLKEGKGHKDVFMKEAKRLFPNIVPNAATFDQTAKLLKQRSVISENIFPLVPSSGLNPFTTFDKYLNEEAKATETKPSKEVEEAGKIGYDYKDNKNLNNQIFDQYIKGLKFEMEQDPELLADEPTEALLKAKDVVAKNLAKDPLYYMKNAAFGIEGIGYEELKNQDEPTGKHKSSGYGDLKENKMNKSTQLKELLEEAVAGIPSIGNPFAERKNETYEDRFAAFLAEERNKKEANEEKEPAKKEKEPTKEEKEVKKEGMGRKMTPENFIKEVEKIGEMAKMRVAKEAYGGKINELKKTLETINEDANLAEFIDQRKTDALQKEIALYEKYYLDAEANYNTGK